MAVVVADILLLVCLVKRMVENVLVSLSSAPINCKRTDFGFVASAELIPQLNIT